MTTADKLAVLVIEDEALIRMEIEDILEDLGHVVAGSAATRAQALDLIAALTEQPDVALVDANLGGDSALPVVEALRALHIPVVIASGYEKAELERLGFSEGTVRKPYRARDIDLALKSVRSAQLS